ncbi:MAG: hypothetical protein AB2L24_04250 [Mangrovibacterium sp.]
MIVYKTRIYSEKGKSALKKSLTERLLNHDNPPIYIFPFCLFSRSFYKDKAVFIGELSNGEFDFDTRNKLIATRTRLPISLKGAIKDNEIEIKYQIPNFAILIILSCVIVDLLFVKSPSNLDNVFYFIAGLLVVRYLFLVIKIQNIFKNISKVDIVRNVQTLNK